MTTVGYARTSTEDQVAGLESQIADLKAAGVERCYSEHISALASHRPQLEACLTWLRDGDTLVVTKPDRLARSVTNLLKLVDDLRARSVNLRILSLDMDTGKATGKLALTIMGAVAEWEREMMLERQKAGVAKAHADGKYQGRKPWVVTDDRAAEVYRLIDAGGTRRGVAEALSMSPMSVYRILRKRPASPQAAE